MLNKVLIGLTVFLVAVFAMIVLSRKARATSSLEMSGQGGSPHVQHNGSGARRPSALDVPGKATAGAAAGCAAGSIGGPPGCVVGAFVGGTGAVAGDAAKTFKPSNLKEIGGGIKEVGNIGKRNAKRAGSKIKKAFGF